MADAMQLDPKQPNSEIHSVALGDSLTHGMQSLGVAWISQHYSYPRLIAEFLGIPIFTQPTLRGGDTPVEGNPREREYANAQHWVGNPPNLELVARAAQALGNVKPEHAKRVQQKISKAIKDESGDAALALREIVADYFHTLDANPGDLLLDKPAENGYYQNLGIYGYLVNDILETKYTGDSQRPSGLGPEASRIARRALSWLSVHWDRFADVHQSVPVSLALVALGFAEGDLGARLNSEKLGYVLHYQENLTAIQALAAQRPRFVTLFIGNNNMMDPVLKAHLYDGNTRLYTPAKDYEEQLRTLVNRILEVDSPPYVFVATLPSPTASPNLVRDRLGHWRPLAPTPAYLNDDEIVEMEQVIAAYNDAIWTIAKEHEGKVWVVDIFSLHARILRATRQDAEAARVAVEHAVRTKALTMDQGLAVLRAARAGNLDTIKELRQLAARLGQRPLDRVEPWTPDASGAGLAAEKFTRLPDPKLEPSKEQLNSFVVRLHPRVPDYDSRQGYRELEPRYYRLTGEYLAAGDDGAIAQGGAVSLDSIHLTNTGYAYVAREFLKKIYEAHEDSHRELLKGLPGADTGPDAFNEKLVEVAEKDTLLNNVPTLVSAVIDLLGAASGALGDVHYKNPTLPRRR